MTKKLIDCLQGPLQFYSVTIGVDFCTSAHNFAVLKLALIDDSIDEDEFASTIHLAVQHLALISDPFAFAAIIWRRKQNTPSVWLVIGPLTLIFYSAVGEKQLTLTMHLVIFPSSFVVAVIFENVFTSAMFKIIFFLADVLITVCILFMHVNQFLLFLHYLLDSSTKLTISH